MYHASGFVQFSSAGKGAIVSGSHPPANFLQPKGLGIHTQPITEPIDTGATMGAQFRGIQKCRELDPNEKTSVIVFRERDMILNVHDPFPTHPESLVGFWFFPGNERKHAVIRNGRWEIDRMLPDVPVLVASDCASGSG